MKFSPDKERVISNQSRKNFKPVENQEATGGLYKIGHLGNKVIFKSSKIFSYLRPDKEKVISNQSKKTSAVKRIRKLLAGLSKLIMIEELENWSSGE